MTSAAVSLVVASCVFGGSILAMYAARALPDSHLSADARDVIKVGMALIATLVALVLGLMIATAKGTYDAQSAVVRQLSANVRGRGRKRLNGDIKTLMGRLPRGVHY